MLFRISNVRFIPMNIGNSPESAMLSTSHTVHPHEYAELVTDGVEDIITNGSSP